MRARRTRRPRFRRPAQLVLGLMLVPIGISHMAHNTVPVTSAGHDQRPVVIPTHLAPLEGGRPDVTQLAAQERYEFTGVGAVLTTQGAAISGQTITFAAEGIRVCTAVTDRRGAARCPDTTAPMGVFGDAPHQVTASFTGTGGVQPASITLPTHTTAPAVDPGDAVLETTDDGDGTMSVTDPQTQGAGTDG